MQEKSYIIRDSSGCFAGSLGLSVKDDGKTTCWDYVASKNADRSYGDKNRAIAMIQMLEEVNNIAGFNGLSWELVYGNYRDFLPWVEKDNILLIEKDIPKGTLTKTRKSVKELYKKYNVIFKEIEMKWREQNNRGGASIGTDC